MLFAYYVSAQVRSADTTTFALSVIDPGLAFNGAFTLPGGLRFRATTALSCAGSSNL